MQFTCRTCGQPHDLEQISFGADRPHQWDLLSDAERGQSQLTDELCVIQAQGQSHFFVRACLEVPIAATDRVFVWGVWVSLSRKSFKEMFDNWENPDRGRLGPYFGWLCTRIPEYPDTMFQKTRVHPRGIGTRPRVELEATDHPLSKHQRQGIPRAELERMVAKLLHGESSGDPSSE